MPTGSRLWQANLQQRCAKNRDRQIQMRPGWDRAQIFPEQNPSDSPPNAICRESFPPSAYEFHPPGHLARRAVHLACLPSHLSRLPAHFIRRRFIWPGCNIIYPVVLSNMCGVIVRVGMGETLSVGSNEKPTSASLLFLLSSVNLRFVAEDEGGCAIGQTTRPTGDNVGLF